MRNFGIFLVVALTGYGAFHFCSKSSTHKSGPNDALEHFENDKTQWHTALYHDRLTVTDAATKTDVVVPIDEITNVSTIGYVIRVETEDRGEIDVDLTGIAGTRELHRFRDEIQQLVDGKEIGGQEIGAKS